MTKMFQGFAGFNPTLRRIILFVLILLSLALLLAPLAAGTIGFMGGDDLTGDDNSAFLGGPPMTWTRIAVDQSSMLLELGLSIFTLFIVYRGGRSKDRIFNDRTIATAAVLKGCLFFVKTAPVRAVFTFLDDPFGPNGYWVYRCIFFSSSSRRFQP